VLVSAPVVVERISTFSGVKPQVAPSGRPEQESVTNIGAVSVAANPGNGMTDTVADPDWPAVRVFMGFVAGVISETAGIKSHSAVTFTGTVADVEAWLVESAIKFALRL
jgi:hypothetical protein